MTTGYIGSTIPARIIRTSTHDNLFQIAMMQTGDPLQWVAIAQLNGLIDPWVQGNSNILIPPVFPNNTSAIVPQIGGSPLALVQQSQPVDPPIYSLPIDPPPIIGVPLPLNQGDWPNPNIRGLLVGDQLGYIKTPHMGTLNGLIPFSPHEMPNPRGRVPLAGDQLGYITTPDLWQLNVNTLFPFAPHEMPNPRGRAPLAGDQLGYTESSAVWMLNGLIPFSPHEMPNPQRARVRNEFGFFDRYKILQTPAVALPFRMTDWQNPRGRKGLAADQLGCLNSIYTYDPTTAGSPMHQPVFSNIYRVKRLNQYIPGRELVP